MNSFDVFISHASEDKKIAHAMCHFLEENGVRCWIAPRDIRHGQNYSEAIIDAISEQCRVLVVVFTQSANNSPYVKSEVERAFHHGLTIISFRVEDVLPSKSLELFLGPTHWLDACSEPVIKHFSLLLSSIASCLNETQGKSAIVVAKDVRKKPRRLFFASFATLFLIVILLISNVSLYVIFFSGREKYQTGSSGGAIAEATTRRKEQALTRKLAHLDDEIACLQQYDETQAGVSEALKDLYLERAEIQADFNLVQRNGGNPSQVGVYE